MKLPDPRDTTSIVTALREHGSVLWPADAITGDFIEWRRRIRSAARAADLRISVRRVNGLVLIEHLDHVVTEDQITAFGKVIASSLPGEQPITYEQAMHQAARERLKPVPRTDPPPH